jgi:peptide/nickel transport system permease protein
MSAAVSQTSAAPVAPPRKSRLWGLILQDKVVLVSLLFLAAVVISTVTYKLLGVDASAASLSTRLKPPSSAHPLGTDGLGRDVMTRIIAGAYNTMLIGAGVVLISGTVGTLLGVLAGYLGGIWDAIVMRMVEIQFAFPNMLLVVAVIYFFSPAVPVLIIVLAAIYWVVFATVVRSAVKTARSNLYVRAAEFAGCSTPTIVIRHILPAVAPVIMTQAVLEFGAVVLTESGLSFLGMGIQPPESSWGLMIAENRQYMEDAWWSVVFPGLAIVATVLSANLISSAFRIWLDPRQNTARHEN